MRIQPIVEGYGDVHAVPVLLRRLRDEARAYSVEVNAPIRKTRYELVNEPLLRKAVRLALLQPECRGIFIVFDGDDDCPKALAPTLLNWAQQEAADVPCALVMAVREYEAWFLASIESLRGKRGIRLDAPLCVEPETPRGAKERLEQLMQRGRAYNETADQAALTAQFDMRSAYRRCRSFRSAVGALGRLLSIMDQTAARLPPDEWRGEA
jgi:hypothetical protein